MWLDTPQSEVLRTCGKRCATTNFRAFVSMSGEYNIGSNGRATRCSIFESGWHNSNGNGAVATGKDLIEVHDMHFTAYQASSSSVSCIASPNDNTVA
jgi:hypothetical protein